MLKRQKGKGTTMAMVTWNGGTWNLRNLLSERERQGHDDGDGDVGRVAGEAWATRRVAATGRRHGRLVGDAERGRVGLPSLLCA